jgi:hypothetical protein
MHRLCVFAIREPCSAAILHVAVPRYEYDCADQPFLVQRRIDHCADAPMQTDRVATEASIDGCSDAAS